MKLKYKKIVIGLCFVFLLSFLISCRDLPEILAPDNYDKQLSGFYNVDENTKKTIKKDRLEFELKVAQQKLEDYEDLVSNLNDYLKNVYYGKANNGSNVLNGFTAFSIKHKGRFYLITAGHCVGREFREYNNHQFRHNLDDEWIMPYLLLYNSGDGCNNDFAVFKSPHISSGLEVSPVFMEPDMLVLGNNHINTLRHNNIGALQGESGSPIINLKGEVVGMITAENGGYTGISTVLENIDEYESLNQPVFSEHFYRLYSTLKERPNAEDGV